MTKISIINSRIVLEGKVAKLGIVRSGGSCVATKPYLLKNHYLGSLILASYSEKTWHWRK